MKTRRKKSFFLIGLLFSVQYCMAGNIVNTADFSYWRALADSIPMFSDMKASSLSIAIQNGETRDVMGGNALAYILNPDKKSTYIAKLLRNKSPMNTAKNLWHWLAKNISLLFQKPLKSTIPITCTLGRVFTAAKNNTKNL